MKKTIESSNRKMIKLIGSIALASTMLFSTVFAVSANQAGTSEATVDEVAFLPSDQQEIGQQWTKTPQKTELSATSEYVWATNQWYFYQEADGYWKLNRAGTELLLSFEDGKLVDTAPNGSDEQLWKLEAIQPWPDSASNPWFYKISNKANGKYISVDDNKTISFISNSDNSEDELFTLFEKTVDTSDRLINGASSGIQCNYNKFVLQSTVTSYSYQNRENNKYLTLSYGDISTDNWGLTTNSSWGGEEIAWNIKSVSKDGDTFYQFINNSTGRALTNFGGCLIETTPDSTSDIQLWSITQSAWNVAYYIVSKADNKQLRMVDGNIVLGSKKTDGIEAANVNVFYLQTSSGNTTTTSYDGLVAVIANPTGGYYLKSTGVKGQVNTLKGDNDWWSTSHDTKWKMVSTGVENEYSFVHKDYSVALTNYNGTLIAAPFNEDSDMQKWQVNEIAGWTKSYIITSVADGRKLTIDNNNNALLLNDSEKAATSNLCSNAQAFGLYNRGFLSAAGDIQVVILRQADTGVSNSGIAISGLTTIDPEPIVVFDSNVRDDGSQIWSELAQLDGRYALYSELANKYLSFNADNSLNLALDSEVISTFEFEVSEGTVTRILSTGTLYGEATALGINPTGEMEIVRLKKHLLGAESITGSGLKTADVNEDKTIDILDLVRLKKVLAGL